MTYEEVWKIIEDSSPEDWTETCTGDGVCEIVYNKDINLRFIDDSGCNYIENFQEDWANRHPDKHAHKHDIRLYYCQSCLESIPVVSVDGGRASLPYPDPETKTIPYREYKAAQIGVQGNSRLDEYIERSGLTVSR